MIDVRLVEPNERDIHLGVPPDMLVFRAVCSTHRRWAEVPLTRAMAEDEPFLVSCVWPRITHALRSGGCDCPNPVYPDIQGFLIS